MLAPTTGQQQARVTIGERRARGYAGLVREGALGGFDDLFNQEHDSIVRAAYLITGDRATAAEVTQDAFTQAVVHWNKVRNYDKPGAWVRRVAVRQAVKVRTRDQRRNRLMIEVAADKRPGHESGVAARLEVALNVLTPKQRAVVVLHYFDGLSVNEAADLLGCRPATASVHLHRARARLAEELGTSSEFPEEAIDA